MRGLRLRATSEPRFQRGMLGTAAVVVATLVCLLCVIFIAAQAPSDARAERIWYVKYRAVPLAQVIGDLEDARAIPRGTVWADPQIRRRRVTVSWLAVSGREAILDLEHLAGVDISYRQGNHGEFLGPITIGLPVPVQSQPGFDMVLYSPAPLSAIFTVLALLFSAPVGAYVLRQKIVEARGGWLVAGRSLQVVGLISAPLAVLAAVGWLLSSH